MKEIGKGGVQARSVNYARAHGWYARKIKSPANNALPDFLFAKRNAQLGRDVSFFVEFKATDKGPSPLQLQEHELMRAAGLMLFVIDDPERFKVLLAHFEP